MQDRSRHLEESLLRHTAGPYIATHGRTTHWVIFDRVSRFRLLDEFGLFPKADLARVPTRGTSVNLSATVKTREQQLISKSAPVETVTRLRPY